MMLKPSFETRSFFGIPHSLQAVSPIERDARERIVRTAIDAVGAVKELRFRDLTRIRNAYRRLGASGLSVANAKRSLEEMRKHVTSIVEHAHGFAGREYLTWNNQVVPESESHYGTWMTRQVIGYAKRYEDSILAQVDALGQPSSALEGLFEIASQDVFFEDSLADGPEGIAAYEAKIMLLYSLPLEERARVCSDLELRFDLRDVAPADEHARWTEERGEDAYSFSVVMDGYFFGALRANAKSLIHGIQGALGVGIDCSTFVQEAYECAGYAHDAFKSPISTGSMIDGDMPGIRDGTFEVKPLKAASELLPGDAILWPGHIQIYLGRDEQERVRIAEAVGRRFKTVRESSLPLRDASGMSVFENPDRPMYVFRPRSGSPLNSSLFGSS